VRQLRPLGAQVASGEPVAEIRTPEGSVVATLPAAAAGTVAVHVTYGIVSAGEAVTVVFTPR
jgi:predicted deacylase